MHRTRPADRPADRPAARPTGRPLRRLRRATAAGAVTVALLAGLAPAAHAAGRSPLPAPSPATDHRLDRSQLQARLKAVQEAGIYGVFSAVRDGRQRFDGAGQTRRHLHRPPRPPGPPAPHRQHHQDVHRRRRAPAVRQGPDRPGPAGRRLRARAPSRRPRPQGDRAHAPQPHQRPRRLRRGRLPLPPEGDPGEPGRAPVPHGAAHRTDRLRRGPAAAVRTRHRLELLQRQLPDPGRGAAQGDRPGPGAADHPGRDPADRPAEHLLPRHGPAHPRRPRPDVREHARAHRPAARLQHLQHDLGRDPCGALVSTPRTSTPSTAPC